MAKNEIAEQATKAVKAKQKRNRPDLANFGAENVEPGYNSVIAEFTEVMDSFPEIDLSDPEQVAQRIKDYRALCRQYDEKQTVSALADSLGLNRRRLWEIVNDVAGRNGKVPSESRDLIKKAYRKLEVQWEQMFMNGKINPVSGIFIAKNHFGYRDTQELDVKQDDRLFNQRDASIIAKEYDALPEV